MSDLPSVAGRMEMTHADFQRACRVAIQDFQQEPQCQSYLVALFCEAVRCSRECCEIATLRPDAIELTTLRSQVEKLTGERDSAIARVHALEEIGFDPRTRQLTQERYQAHARLNEARDLLGDAIAHPGKNSEWGSRRDTWLKGTP